MPWQIVKDYLKVLLSKEEDASSEEVNGGRRGRELGSSARSPGERNIP